MNRQDIIPRTEVLRMAREADLGFLLNENWLMHEELERFAALVASAEREACAKVCDDELKEWGIFDSDVGDVSKAIRARGQA